MWYGNLRCTNGERVQLDADSTRGYGPETMTFDQVASGKYSYMVNKYTAGSPVAMKDSQAVVQELRSCFLVDSADPAHCCTPKAADARARTHARTHANTCVCAESLPPSPPPRLRFCRPTSGPG